MIWRIYGLIILALLLAAWINIPNSQLGAMDIMDIPITLVGMSGLFAYAFRKRLLIPNFWKIWAFMQVIWDITYNAVSSDGVSQLVVILASFLPLYAALFLYGYRSRPLWAEVTKA
jgi:hypothetical protein